ncbi:DNA methyltransferase [Bacillus anthracis]
MGNDEKQLSLLGEHIQADNGPVVCLGMKFENDEARREYFRNELRKKLPELKEIEGFPIGEDEDIIALSDPPYYTACPNPWINEFIREWEREKVEKYGRDANEEYHKEPFASDVSEGKNDPIYNAHSYHTKVPYKAIIKFLLHYTEPGDVILDAFCGTGMTGVAAKKMCKRRRFTITGF